MNLESLQMVKVMFPNTLSVLPFLRYTLRYDFNLLGFAPLPSFFSEKLSQIIN